MAGVGWIAETAKCRRETGGLTEVTVGKPERVDGWDANGTMD